MNMEDDFMDTQEIPQEMKTLSFSEDLVSNKPLKVNELATLLKKLHLELKDLDQNVDQNSLTTVTQQLIHKQVLKSSNKAVKALTACCLADIIRLHAPNCPFLEEQLKSVFNLFVEQLSHFGIANSPDFEYHFYLLENLQLVKTFLLLNETSSAEEIVLPLFGTFFDAAEKGHLIKNVELCMTDVMIQLIEDVGITSPDVTELILEQFEKHDKGSTNSAYVMALDICYACPNIMQRKVFQYFSENLLSASTAAPQDNSEEFEEIKRAHGLIRKINAIVPDILLNVFPLLQEEMKVDHINIRQLATETMGQMFADPASWAIAEKYPVIWKTWLGRRDDKSVALRIKWLETSVDIYRNHPASAAELIECFKGKLADPDEKVRAMTCKILGEIGMESNLASLDKALLESIAERTKDKKNSVRAEAMRTIGSIYQNCYPSIQAESKAAVQKVGWIPNSVINRLYVGDLSVTMNLESTLHEFILPEIENDEERTQRLLTIVESLKPKQKIAFTALVRKEKAFNEHMHTFIKMCEDELDDNMSEHETAKSDEFMKYMAAFFPDKSRTLNVLRSFLRRKSSKDIKLLTTAVDLNSDYKRVCTAKRKLLASLNNDQSAVLEIFQSLLNRSSPLILNKSNVPHLLKASKLVRAGRRPSAAATQRAATAQEMLKEMSTTYPTMYSSYMKDILQEIMDDNDSTADEGLELLSEISKANNGDMVYNADVRERLMDFVANGNSAEAEYAATALANMKNADIQLADLSTSLCDSLTLTNPELLNALISLAQFALYSSQLVTPSMDSIIQFIDTDLLPANTREFNDKNPDWETYDDLPELSQQKLVAVRLLVNYLTACKESEGPEDYVIHKIFTMLWELLDRSCDSASADKTNMAETSQLRLAGGQAIVTLTTYAKYMNELTVSKFERLSVLLQDPVFFVRAEFSESLMKGLQTEQIHPRYYALLFICAHEPDANLIKQVKSFIQKRLAHMDVKSGESTVLDSSLIRLIHLLAHHPDFSVAVDDLNLFCKYFHFYLACVATPDNVSFLYHIVQKIKLSKDIVHEELSQNSYVLSDLACALIKKKCHDASWPLAAYEGHVSLQSKLYRTLPSGTIQTETMKKSYLPADFVKELESEHKSGEKRSKAASAAANKRLKAEE